MKELYARLMYIFFPIIFIIDWIYSPETLFKVRLINVHKAWKEVFFK